MTDDPADRKSEATGAKPSVDWITVGPEHAGQRIDNFLRTQLKGAPKSLIYRILRTGEVRVNKGRAKPEYKIKAGDLIRVPPLRLAEDMPVAVGASLKQTLHDAIVYEDDELMLLDKPAGLAVHAGSGVRVGVIEALRALLPELPGIELAHRLDRDTSGLLMLAKDRRTLLSLHELLREDRIKKTYLAIVHGHWPDKRTEVDAPLAKNALRGGERMVEVADDGKPSITRFRVVERLTDATLIEAMPITGRTHQIRVHAAHTDHPILGDDKYGDPELDRALCSDVGRLCLHAARIQIPRAGKSDLQVEASLPDELTRLLTSLRARSRR